MSPRPLWAASWLRGPGLQLRPPGPRTQQAGAVEERARVRARQSHLRAQLPTGSRQASGSRLTLVRREQKGVSEVAPPSPSQAGKSFLCFQARQPARRACGFHRALSFLAWSYLGRDSPSCLLGRCPQGGQCLQGIPERKQRAGVTHRDCEGRCQEHRSSRGLT